MFRRANRTHKAYTREVEAFRQQKDRFFATSPQSPLLVGQRHGNLSSGLSYFLPNLAFRVEADVALFAQPQLIEMATSTGEHRHQVRYAELRFRIGDQDLRLTGYADPHQRHTHELFVPFRDTTSGRETYEAGRYLEVELEHHAGGVHTTTIDFNLAYNPYCAYSPAYSCPIPPAENRLSVAITAGERVYTAGH
jgi:uncharacterized protein (DUF1684 family)